MPEVTPHQEDAARPRTDWGAVWAGVFTFSAIWPVFEALGFAIFASAASSGSTNSVTGMGLGMGIWTIVLTIIAMYVAGRETGRLAAVMNRHDGLIHGVIMFGLSVVRHSRSFSWAEPAVAASLCLPQLVPHICSISLARRAG